MKKRLRKLSTKVKDGSIDYINVENTFKSWMGSYYKLLSKKQRLSLISLYEELFNKSIHLDKGSMYII